MNFLSLRDHADAQPEIHAVAKAIRAARESSEPKELAPGEWHLPFVRRFEREWLPDLLPDIESLKLLSAARCASTSYITVDGVALDALRAQGLAQKLLKSDPIHASPFEHQLTPDELVEIDYRVHGSKKKYKTTTVWKNPHLHGNTRGFIQYRKTLPNESKERNVDLFLTFD